MPKKTKPKKLSKDEVVKNLARCCFQNGALLYRGDGLLSENVPISDDFEIVEYNRIWGTDGETETHRIFGYIPAGPGFFLLEKLRDDHLGPFTSVIKEPVLAWALTGDQARPVVHDWNFKNDRLALMYPDGTINVDHHFYYKSVEEYLAGENKLLTKKLEGTPEDA